MIPYWTSPDGRHVIYCGDCLDILPTLAARSVSIVCTDPPYHGVKEDDWDNQWATDAAFLAWVSQVCGLVDGVLAPNGSLYWFASPQMADMVSVEIRKTFNVLNNLCWFKGLSAGGSKKDVTSLRRYWPNTERIIFAERYNSDNAAKGEAGYIGKCDELRGFVFEPLRAYIAGEWQRAGLTSRDANAATSSQMAGHYLTRVQWTLPTSEKYEQLRAYANSKGGEYMRRDYEDLRRDYEDLRRPFSVTTRDEWGDVWRFPIERKQVHPTQKPLAMLAHIVKTSSRDDGSVLDPFMGSGTTGVACVKLGRKFIGIEISREYCDIAVKRLERELSQPHLPWPEPQAVEVQGTMFENK